MDEPSNTRRELWRARLRRFRALVRKATPFAAGVAMTFAALLLYRAAFPPAHQLTTREVNDLASQVMASATAPPAYSAMVYQVIRPSLVLIQVKGQDTTGEKHDGLGSGVVVDDQGDILTALHVVKNTSEIQVTFADGSQSSAQLVTQQADSDIAVLRADQPPAQIIPAVLGNPNAMNVGDEAYVVGNPFGLYASMTSGVISGFDRSFTPPNGEQKLKGLIQIDAAVNPGNSGGPLLNRGGQVIGIVTGLVNPTDQDVFIGIGFAVPINVAGGAVGSPPY
jgi:S1-C subfamily serine protease